MRTDVWSIKDLSRKECYLYGGLSFLFIVSLLINLGDPAFMTEESRRALIAFEMKLNGNIWVPTEFGDYYYKKPPLFNWTILGMWKLTGVNEWGPRLVTVFSLIGMGLVTYLFLIKRYGFHIAWWTAMFTMLSADIYFSFSLFGEIDIFYSFITLGGILALVHWGWKGEWWKAFFIAYSCHALGVLAKGLPSFVFVGLTTIVFLVYRREWKQFFSIPHLSAILFFAVIIVGYALKYTEYNSLLGYKTDLFSQSNERTAWENSMMLLFRHFINFPTLVLKNLLPVTIFLPILLSRKVRRAIIADKYIMLLGWIFLINIFIYWISPGARSRYLYMLHPFPILIIVFAIRQNFNFIRRYGEITTFVIGGLLPLGFLSLLFIPDLEFPAKTIVVILGFLLTAPLFYFRLNGKPGVLNSIIMLTIIARIAFDLIVMPIRSNEGMHTSYKNDAAFIQEIVGDHDLAYIDDKGDQYLSRALTFYLSRERDKIIPITSEVNEDSYYLTIYPETRKVTHRVIDTFKLPASDIYLIGLGKDE